MKTAKAKTPANAAKEQSSFFSQESEQDFFGSAEKENSFFPASNGNDASPVQPKLSVGQVNDPFEKEADSVADRVVQRMGNPEKKNIREDDEQADPEKISRKPIFESDAEPSEDELPQAKLQRKENKNAASAEVSSSVESRLSGSKGKGDPLPREVNHTMSQAFGADFSHVRIHHDTGAAALSKDLQAQAFTHGNDIYFNSGKYDTSSQAGKHLLAHELTHTVQQGKAGSSIAKSGSSSPSIQKSNDPPLSVPDKIKKITTTLANGDFIKVDGSSIEIHLKKIILKAYVENIPPAAIQKPPKGKDRKTNQRPKWTAGTKKDVTTSLESVHKPESPGELLSLYLKGTNDKKKENPDQAMVEMFGTTADLAEEIAVPFWDIKGKNTIHEVEHAIDVQILGSDEADKIANFVLIDKESNRDLNTEVKQMITKRVGEVLKHYQIQNDVTVGAALTDYKIWFDSFEKEATNKTKSIIRAKDFQKTDNTNPIHSDHIIVQKKEIPAGHLLLKMGKGGVGYILPYNFKSDVFKLKVNSENKLVEIILLSLFKDEKTQVSTLKELPVKFSQPDPKQPVYTIDAPALYGSTGLIANNLKFKYLSPIELNDDMILNPHTGLRATGKINTRLKILEGAEIEFFADNGNFGVKASITSEKIKAPAPFSVKYCTLDMQASSNMDFSVGGEIGIAIKGLGEGFLSARQGTKGFSLTGEFKLDKKIFDGKITVGFEKGVDEEEGKWSIGGEITVGPNKITGLQKLNVTFSRNQELLTGTGKATLSIKGIKEIVITAKADDKGKFLVSGDVTLSDIPKLEGATAKFTVDEEWNVSLSGKAKPKLDVQGLTADEVTITYDKGAFEITAGAHYNKGRIHGDFNLGVTNKPVSADGKKAGETAGKELNFYATGKITVDIAEGIGSEIDVMVRPDGDIILDGKIMLTKAKPLLPEVPFSKSFTPLDQNIPLASCVVVTVNLHIAGEITFYANLKPLQFDEGSYVQLSNVSLKKFSNPAITAKIDLSSHFDAGVKVGLTLGINLALLGVLLAEVAGKGTLDFQAISADARAHFGAKWSAEKGIQLTDSTLEFELKSKLIASLSALLTVYANLLVTKITIWQHKWDLGEKEFVLNLFGKGKKTIQLPVREDGGVDLTMDKLGNSVKDVGDSVSQKAISDQSKSMMDGNGDNTVDKQQEVNKVTKEGVLERFRDPIRFQFDKCVNFLKERYDLYNHLKAKGGKGDEKVDFSYIDEEIKKAEYEEYDAFGPWLASEKTFSAEAKYQLIDDFMYNHPTLGPAQKAILKSVVDKNQPGKGTAPIQRKEEEGTETNQQSTVAPPPRPDKDFNNNMQVAQAPGTTDTSNTIADKRQANIQETEPKNIPGRPATTSMIDTIGAGKKKEEVPGKKEALAEKKEDEKKAVTDKTDKTINDKKEKAGEPAPVSENGKTTENKNGIEKTSVEELSGEDKEKGSREGDKPKPEAIGNAVKKEAAGETSAKDKPGQTDTAGKKEEESKSGKPGKEDKDKKSGEKKQGKAGHDKEKNAEEENILSKKNTHLPDIAGNVTREFHPLPPLGDLLKEDRKEQPKNEPAEKVPAVQKQEEPGAAEQGDAARDEYVNRIGNCKKNVADSVEKEVATLRDGVQQNAGMVKNSTLSLIRNAIQETKGKFDGARQELTVAISNTQIIITTQFITKVAETILHGQKTKTDITDSFKQHKLDIDTAAKDGVANAYKMQERYQGEARDQVNNQIKTARSMREQKAASYPDTERGHVQKDAAREMANETISEMAAKTPETLDAIAEIIKPIPDEFNKKAEEAKNGLDEHAAVLVQDVDAKVLEIVGQLQIAYQAAMEQVKQAKEKLESELTKLEEISTRQLQKLIPQVIGQIDTAVTASVEGLETSKTNLIAQLSGKADEAILILKEAQNPDVAGVQSFGNTIISFLQTSSSEAVGVFKESVLKMEEDTAGIYDNVMSTVNIFSHSTDRALMKWRQMMELSLQSLMEKNKLDMQGIYDSMAAAFDQVVLEIKGVLGKNLEELKAGYEKTLKDAEPKIKQAIQEGLAKNDEALNDMSGKMEEAADDAAWDYDHPILSAIGDVLSFIAGLVLGLLAILALVIVVIIAFKLLIAGLVALGISLVVAQIIAAVAGLALLARGVYNAYEARKERGEGGGWATFGKSLLDVSGITSIYHGMTAEGLSPFERGFSIGEGIGTLASFFLARKIDGAITGKLPPAIANPGGGTPSVRGALPRGGGGSGKLADVIPIERGRIIRAGRSGGGGTSSGPTNFYGRGGGGTALAPKIVPETVPEVAPEVVPESVPDTGPVAKAGKAPASSSLPTIAAGAATGLKPKKKKKDEDAGLLYMWKNINYDGRVGEVTYSGKTRPGVDYTPNSHHVWPMTLGGLPSQTLMTVIRTIHSEEMHYGRSPVGSPVVAVAGSIYEFLQNTLDGSPTYGPGGLNILQGRKLTHPGGANSGNELLIKAMKPKGSSTAKKLAAFVRLALTQYYALFQAYSNPQVPYKAYRKGLDDTFNDLV